MDFHKMIGFGVAGNFTGHLEQAGEDSDFVDVVAEENAPKGMFPFFIPKGDHPFANIYPLSSSTIQSIDSQNLQVEPEVAIVCELLYQDEKVTSILPTYFCAFNDCSIRKRGAKKISEKKNWGANSKGVSQTFIPIDEFSSEGKIGNYNIISFHKRNGVLTQYGLDSPVKSYSYFGEELLSWMQEKLNSQEEQGPLENIHQLIKQAGFPKKTLISIGATKYTNFGEAVYLQKNDEVFVVVYDTLQYTKEDIKRKIIENKQILHASVLQQKVI